MPDATAPEFTNPNLPTSTDILITPRTQATLTDFSNFWDDRIGIQNLPSIHPDRNQALWGDIVNHFLTGSDRYSSEERVALLDRYKEEYGIFKAEMEGLENVDFIEPSEEEKAKPNNFSFLLLNGFQERQNTDDIGKIYLNFDPNKQLGLMKGIVDKLCQSQIPCSIKTGYARSMNAGYFANTDRVVMHFAPDQQEVVAKCLREFYQENATQFVHDVPRMATNLVDANGFVMEGIAFAEEPKEKNSLSGKKLSFNQHRGQLLMDTLLASRHIPKTERDQHFINYCMSYGVDPKNPAFNQESDFMQMREYVSEK